VFILLDLRRRILQLQILKELRDASGCRETMRQNFTAKVTIRLALCQGIVPWWGGNLWTNGGLTNGSLQTAKLTLP
jgi:hypothetical protein